MGGSHHPIPGKYEKDVECGGGYLKVGPKMSDAKAFGDPTAYNIMFGPDKCGMTTRTHLIFTYKGKNILKKSEEDDAKAAEDKKDDAKDDKDADDDDEKKRRGLRGW